MALSDHEWRWGQRRRLPPTTTSHGTSTDVSLWDRFQPGNDNRKIQDEPARELDCLVGALAPALLRDAAQRACELGVGADRILIRWGVIDEAAYLLRLAAHIGVGTETFAAIERGDIALRDEELGFAAQHGLMPLQVGRDRVWVIAPRALAARQLTKLLARYPAIADHLRIAMAADMEDFLLHRTGDPLAHAAARGLRTRFPALSAAPNHTARARRSPSIRAACATIALTGLMMLPPGFGLDAWSQIVALWFLAAIWLRLLAALQPRQSAPDVQPFSDAELPVYTVIVALYREATSVAPLLRALADLDYPREKLDLILAVEPDDLDTRAAIARFGAVPHLRTLIAPDIQPRTKPKALNSALAFARGSFVAVFDAEDRPDPGQLRAALDAFHAAGDDVACVQASLCIDNSDDSLFTRMFAAEYAGQFDVVLPGLAALKLPLPLGGSSNHFRTDVLRAVGGWDAWDVTEDADLGLRLARFGHRAATFVSTTQEEAPISFGPWLRQRSRWMKGWMQTWSVHMREPRQLWRDAGWPGLLTLNLVIGGLVLSALAYPVLVAQLAIELLHRANGVSGWWFYGLMQPVHFAAIVSGLGVTAVVGLMGLSRRGRLRDGWILLLTPLYWGCLSIAAWRALWQLLHDPYRWEKTEHGLAARPMRHSINPGSLPRASRFARQRP